MGMPNGIHGAHANREAGIGGVSSPADVVMSDLPAAETAPEAAKAAVTPVDGQIAGRKTACLRKEVEGVTLAVIDSITGNLFKALILCYADASVDADVMADHQANPSGNVTQAVSEPKDPLLEAFESQQEAVTADPGDFDKWVKLIGAAERLVCSFSTC